MSDLLSRMSDGLLDIRAGDLLPRVPRRVQRAVEAEVGRGMVRAARTQAETYIAHTRVEGASFVARAGMARVAELTAEEQRYLERTPTTMAANRYRAIGDAFASMVANEVIKLGYDL